MSNEKQMKNRNDGQDAIVGTEILDPSLPSNLDFSKKNYEEDFVMQRPKVQFKHAIDIQKYNVKGKVIFSMDEIYPKGTLLNADLKTFYVQSLDQQKLGALKFIWSSIIGYANLEIYIHEGYLYYFQRCKVGYHVCSVWKLEKLFKVFYDFIDHKIRLIFKDNTKKNQLKVKNFQSDQCQLILQKIAEELNKIGLCLEQ